jgi:hypothetical protein
MAVAELTWHATGGAIDSEGVFVAGRDEGSFAVTASAAGVNDMATVVVQDETKPPPPPPPPPPDTGITWTGEIPPQKWMNFYMKVLSKFANEKSLELTVGVRVTPEDGMSPQKVEEMRQALRELGLDDTVESR